MAIATFHVGVKAVIVRDDKILLVKHKVRGTWDLPGGRIDDSESIERTLRRELKEELSIKSDITIGDVVYALRDPSRTSDDGTGVVLIAYAVTLGNEKQLDVSEEHTEIAWMSLDDALVQGSDMVQEIIKQLG
jgi:ADP-ribose pyrophosphatase YjhB (NUDIX family)